MDLKTRIKISEESLEQLNNLLNKIKELNEEVEKFNQNKIVVNIEVQ